MATLRYFQYVIFDQLQIQVWVDCTHAIQKWFGSLLAQILLSIDLQGGREAALFLLKALLIQLH